MANSEARPEEGWMQGFYAQTWVYVALESRNGGPVRSENYTDAQLRELAEEQWADDGEVEFDDDFRISRSIVDPDGRDIPDKSA